MQQLCAKKERKKVVKLSIILEFHSRPPEIWNSFVSAPEVEMLYDQSISSSIGRVCDKSCYRKVRLWQRYVRNWIICILGNSAKNKKGTHNEMLLTLSLSLFPISLSLSLLSLTLFFIYLSLSPFSISLSLFLSISPLSHFLPLSLSFFRNSQD